MSYQRKSRNGNVRVVEQLNRLFPEEAPWRYRFMQPPFWIGTAGTMVVTIKDGNYRYCAFPDPFARNEKVLTVREGVLFVVETAIADDGV